MIPFRNSPKPFFPPIFLLIISTILLTAFDAGVCRAETTPLEVTVIRWNGEAAESRRMVRARESNGKLTVNGDAYEISWSDAFDAASTDFSIIMDNSRDVRKGKSSRGRNQPSDEYLERIAREVRGKNAAILFIPGNFLGDGRMRRLNRDYSDIILFANGKNSLKIALKRVILRRRLLGPAEIRESALDSTPESTPDTTPDSMSDSTSDSTPKDSEPEEEGLTDLSEFIENSINRNLDGRMESIEQSISEKLGQGQGGYSGVIGALSFSNPIIMLSSIFLGLLFLIVVVLFIMVGKLKYIGRNIGQNIGAGSNMSSRNRHTPVESVETIYAPAPRRKTTMEETSDEVESTGSYELPSDEEFMESDEDFREDSDDLEEMGVEELPGDVEFTESDDDFSEEEEEELPSSGELVESLEETEPEELPADVELTESDEDFQEDEEELEEPGTEELPADVEFIESDEMPEETEALESSEEIPPDPDDVEEAAKSKKKKKSENGIEMDDDDIPEF